MLISCIKKIPFNDFPPSISFSSVISSSKYSVHLYTLALLFSFHHIHCLALQVFLSFLSISLETHYVPFVAFATSLFATSCCYIRLKIIIILFTKGQHNCLFCFYLRPLFSVSKHFATLLHQCSKRQLQVVHCWVWKGFSRVTFPFSVGTLPNLVAHFLQPF